jgi:hypothetical protein
MSRGFAMEDRSIQREGWIRVTGSADRQLEEILARRVDTRIAAGDYTSADINGVGELHRLGGHGPLALSPETLNHLRRLCQLWEVDLKPSPKITSHRKIIGPFIVFVKKLAFPVVRFFMRETLKQQRDFNGAVLEAVARLSADLEARQAPAVRASIDEAKSKRGD